MIGVFEPFPKSGMHQKAGTKHIEHSTVHINRGAQRGRVKIEKISGGSLLLPAEAPRTLSANSSEIILMVFGDDDVDGDNEDEDDADDHDIMTVRNLQI